MFVTRPREPDDIEQDTHAPSVAQFHHHAHQHQPMRPQRHRRKVMTNMSVSISPSIPVGADRHAIHATRSSPTVYRAAPVPWVSPSRYSTFAAHALAHIGLPAWRVCSIAGILGPGSLPAGALVIGALGKKPRNAKRQNRASLRHRSGHSSHDASVGIATDAIICSPDSDNRRRSGNRVRDFRHRTRHTRRHLPPTAVQFIDEQVAQAKDVRSG